MQKLKCHTEGCNNFRRYDPRDKPLSARCSKCLIKRTEERRQEEDDVAHNKEFKKRIWKDLRHRRWKDRQENKLGKTPEKKK